MSVKKIALPIQSIKNYGDKWECCCCISVVFTFLFNSLMAVIGKFDGYSMSGIIIMCTKANSSVCFTFEPWLGVHCVWDYIGQCNRKTNLMKIFWDVMSSFELHTYGKKPRKHHHKFTHFITLSGFGDFLSDDFCVAMQIIPFPQKVIHKCYNFIHLLETRWNQKLLTKWEYISSD